MIMTGDAQACLVGGVEHMGHVPMSHGVDFTRPEPQCRQSGGHDGLNSRNAGAYARYQP